MITSTGKSLLAKIIEEGTEDKEYVLLEPEILNARSLSPSPCAHNQHLFEVDECGKINKSVCEKFEMPPADADRYGKQLKAPEMRRKAAAIGRPVCGICVSNLYGKDN